jgi:hypothetical protein
MGLCNSAKAFGKKILSKVDKYLTEHVDHALRVTGRIKQLLESPAGVILTDVIPGDLDNKIRVKLIAALTTSIDALSIVDKCGSITDPAAKAQCFITELAKLKPSVKEAFLFKLASLIISELDGNMLKRYEYDFITQGRYAASK